MPENRQIHVAKLNLDLANFRTVPQQDEVQAIRTMITISPNRFYGLLESILNDGYHPTENIILYESISGTHVVKEGNRRIAALKIALGFVNDVEIPDNITKKIQELGSDWHKTNSSVPCLIYPKGELEVVDRIISLTHAKGEMASRDEWTAVARARYDRDKKKVFTPGLNLLEAYLVKGKNLTKEQAERWSGDYPLTVLDEALQKLYSCIGYSSTNELVNAYPNKNKRILDKILLDIGISQLGFKEIRDRHIFFGSKYGVESNKTQAEQSSSQAEQSSSQAEQSSSQAEQSSSQAGQSPSQGQSSSGKRVAVSLTDPRAIKNTLRHFSPKGNGREKIVALLAELKLLDIRTHPYAFCFVLRSIFELSAKAYCNDHKKTNGPQSVDQNGNDKLLCNILRDIVQHATKNNADREKKKVLHGALTELAKPDGVLSITSMNQLVHNLTFSIQSNDLCMMFGNVFPLLEEMNR